MAILTDLPHEVLSITAADSGLTNRDHKAARLTCKKLARIMTATIFRRAYISRIKTDRDAFLSLTDTPHLAAHVEEIIWFELEIDLKEGKRVDVQLPGGSLVNLCEAAQDIFWLPVEPKFRSYEGYNSEIAIPSPPECATKFLAQFKAAVARMPKLHIFTSERMDPRRTVSLIDGFPFEVGLLMKYEGEDNYMAWSDFLHIFLETIVEEKGRINKLCCGNELSASLAQIDPRHHAAMPYLTSLQLSISYEMLSVMEPLDSLRNAMYKATELRELSVSLYYKFTLMPWPPVDIHELMQTRYKVHKWDHLRSLKLRAIHGSTRTILRMIESHVKTLRHLHLDRCCPGASFARELSELDGLHLDSITISDFKIPNSDLVSEEELLRFIHGDDVGDKRLTGKIGKGEFVTHNRRTDDINDKAFEGFVIDLHSEPDYSDEWWSDTDSDSELDTVSTS